ITNQMNAYGDKQSDLGIIDKVLRILTPRFDHIVVEIEQGQNLEEMKIEELQGNEYRNKWVPRNAYEAQLAQDEDSDFDNVLLMATTNSEEDNVNLWYLDTGCSNHMTGHREWFVNIDDKVKSTIKFIDNSSVTAKGIGKVMIQRKDGQQSFINDVLYAPNMKNNLLSLGHLLEKGYSMQMDDSQMKIFDSKRRLILKASLL
ncbi:hypothetical protein glysoja_032982, partial [Glycine soja]